MLSLSAVAGSSGAGCGVNSNGVVVKPDTHVSLCLGLTIAPFLFILGVGGTDELTFLGKESEAKNVRTDYINPQVFELLLTALMPANRLALQLSLATGLRISDCLALRTDVLKRSNRPTITEKKTHKHRRVYIPQELSRDGWTSADREPARRCTKTCGELPSFTGLTVSRYGAT